MSFASIPASDDILSYTDEEVSANWKKGLARAAAKLLVSHGQVDGLSIGGFYATHIREGSPAAHYYEGSDFGSFGTPKPQCEIVSVTGLRDDTSERYQYDSFGPGETITDAGFSGVLVCEHGRELPATYMTSISDLLYELMACD